MAYCVIKLSNNKTNTKACGLRDPIQSSATLEGLLTSIRHRSRALRGLFLKPNKSHIA